MAKSVPKKKAAPGRKPATAGPSSREQASTGPPPPPLLRLSEIVGQEAAVARLRKATSAGRLPHALLFCGPDGVGKQTTARALAAALLCSKPGGGPGQGPLDPCGACHDCRMVQAGMHPDFNLIYKELAAYHPDPEVRNRVMQEMSIDVIRHFLIAPASSAPARGRAKVFVVQDAELMSSDSQNCLLKTLEEPPPRVTLILLAERPEELLPTTISRCSLVRFGPLPAAFVQGKLAAAGIAEGEARFWAAQTEGSVGEALRLAKEAMVEADEKRGLPAEYLYAAKRKLVDGIAALGGGDAGLADLLQKVMEKLAASAVERAKAASGAELSAKLAARQGVAIVLKLLASAIRDALHVRCAADAGQSPPPLVHADQPEAIHAIARRFRPEQFAEILEQLSEFERLLWRNVSAKIIWDNVVITLSSAAPLRT